MKIYTNIVMNWDGDVLESESYDYDGPMSLCKGGGKGGSTKTPEVVQPATKAPTKDVTASMNAARAKQQEQAASNAGVKASVLTSDSSGGVDPAKKTLLGQ